MGMFWDLLQQSQISRHDHRSGELEQRLAYVEAELRRTQEVLHAVIARLETQFTQDFNSDGRIG